MDDNDDQYSKPEYISKESSYRWAGSLFSAVSTAAPYFAKITGQTTIQAERTLNTKLYETTAGKRKRDYSNVTRHIIKVHDKLAIYANL